MMVTIVLVRLGFTSLIHVIFLFSINLTILNSESFSKFCSISSFFRFEGLQLLD